MSQHERAMTGIVPPVLTPLTDGGRPDGPALRRLLDSLADAGVGGLFIAGTAGLGPLLPDRDWRAVVELAIDHVGDRLPLPAGVMETSTPRAVERIEHLERLGYRAFVLTPTFYLPPRDEAAHLDHFRRCRDASSMSMVLYNIPGCTGCAIPPAVVEALAAEGAIAAIKDSSGEAAYLERLCAIGRGHGFGVFQGNRPDLAQLAAAGAAGLVPVPANVAPAVFVQAWRAVESGDAGRLADAQRSVDACWLALVGAGNDWVSGATYALGRLGMGGGRSLPPIPPAPTERRAAVDRLLADLQLVQPKGTEA